MPRNKNTISDRTRSLLILSVSLAVVLSTAVPPARAHDVPASQQRPDVTSLDYADHVRADLNSDLEIGSHLRRSRAGVGLSVIAFQMGVAMMATGPTLFSEWCWSDEDCDPDILPAGQGLIVGGALLSVASLVGLAASIKHLRRAKRDQRDHDRRVQRYSFTPPPPARPALIRF